MILNPSANAFQLGVPLQIAIIKIFTQSSKPVPHVFDFLSSFGQTQFLRVRSCMC